MKTYFNATVLAIALIPASVGAQPQPSGSSTGGNGIPATTVVGTVVLVKPSSVVVKTNDDRYFVFAVDRGTLKPKTLEPGAHVRVEASPAEGIGETGDQRADSITPTGEAAAPAAPVNEDALPPEVRRMENQIARAARLYRLGIRGGVALDPELVDIGAHVTLGPVFSRRVFARPNVEFAYGELTTLFAINLEGIYRLSSGEVRRSWVPYFGGGPTLGFSHLGFSTPEGTDRSFNFGDFNFNAGINLLAGLERPSGAFLEIKSTIYTDPHFRLLFGFTF
jgi:hypothetical protein